MLGGVWKKFGSSQPRVGIPVLVNLPSVVVSRSGSLSTGGHDICVQDCLENSADIHVFPWSVT